MQTLFSLVMIVSMVALLPAAIAYFVLLHSFSKLAEKQMPSQWNAEASVVWPPRTRYQIAAKALRKLKTDPSNKEFLSEEGMKAAAWAQGSLILVMSIFLSWVLSATILMGFFGSGKP